MANFGDDVIKNVMKENLNKEAEAFGKLSTAERAAAHLSALLFLGPEKAAKLIDTVTAAGLQDYMLKYAEYAYMSGFSKGYEKGRISMLEDSK